MKLEEIKAVIASGKTVLDDDGDEVVFACKKGYVIKGNPEFFDATWLFERFTIKKVNLFDFVAPDCRFWDEKKEDWTYAYSKELIDKVMKLAEGHTPKDLEKFGFEEITEEYIRLNGLEYTTLEYTKGWAYCMGESCYGQLYYLICSPEGEFSLFASKPSGDSYLLLLAEDNIIKALYENRVAL